VRVAGHGRSVRVPEGWHARIYRHSGGAPILHVASFALSAHDGDYGAAATGRMRPGDCFAALIEFTDGDRELFRPARALPELSSSDFHARRLQVTRAGHYGAQHFLSLDGRPFCLYAVVVPRGRNARDEVAALRAVLRTVSFQ
jgi:hypothetical protein